MEKPEPILEKATEEKLTEIKPEVKTEPPKKPKRRLRKLFYLLSFFGGVALALEYNKLLNQNPGASENDFDNRPSVTFDSGISEEAKKLRIAEIRQSLNQKLEEEFKELPIDQMQELNAKRQEIVAEIEHILGFDKLSEEDKAKYADISQNSAETVSKVQEDTLTYKNKHQNVQNELERLEKVKKIIDEEIDELKKEFQKAENDIESHREDSMAGFKERLDTFMGEFNKIKTENESTAASYLNKIKTLIEEGEEHIKDIDAKIPKDLKSAKEDIRARYIKLKFLIKEYYRDQKDASERYASIQRYLEKSKKALKQTMNMEEETDKMAAVRKLKDEQHILQNLIARMKSEIEQTRGDLESRAKRLERIKKLSANKKVDMLKYYNSIDRLCTQMDRASRVGGTVSFQLKEVVTHTNGEDTLVKAISDDLLSNRLTSADVITEKKIEEYFKQHRDTFYWD